VDGGRPLITRIALVAPSLDILGGQGVQAHTLRQLLEREGYAVDFIPINPRFPRGAGCVRRVPYLRTIVNEALYAWSLRRLRGCDVVHVFAAAYWSFLLTVVPATAAARLFGKPLVLNYHSGEAGDHLARWGALVHPLLRAAGDLVVPSEYLRRVFARHGHRARVVPNALSFAGFTYRRRVPLRPRILSTRNLERHYGVGDVIEAFARVRRRRPDATLAVAGVGSEEPRLRALARERCPEGVTFLGRVDPGEIPALCDRCDVYVNASLVDNQPLSILEAFAAGLPVVSTPTGDISSMIESGETGLLVPERDPGALAAAIESLLDDPERAARMARRAHERVQAHAWREVRQGWLQVYAGARA
jgi:glycosyltransferase involved in cell wall biosynthesis